ncbi:hypothetical protein BJX65DRAFT_280922 [Aspergillus insuetus]
MSLPSNLNQAAPVDKVAKPREKFRTSCDACAASKVRCSKEQPRCVRCVQHDHKCVYGRSRRKGKPPRIANRASSLQAPHPRQPTRGAGPFGDNRWHLADMFANTSYAGTVPDNILHGGWEEIVNSIAGFATHESTVPTRSTPEPYSMDFQTLLSFPSPGPEVPFPLGGQPGMAGSIALDTTLNDSNSDLEENDHDEGGMDLEEQELGPYETAHESCIAAACQTLSSLYQAIRSHSHGPDRSARPGPLQRSPSSDVVVSTARTATQTVLRLLRCACSSAHDPSLLSLLATIISKIIAWYQLLYDHNIVSGSISSSSAKDAPQREEGSRGDDDASCATNPSSTTTTSKQDHLYNVPLSIGTLRLPHDTEAKLKAQLLLCELEPVVDASQLFTAGVRSSEVTWGERVICAEFDTQIQRRVGYLKKLLTEACSLECPFDQVRSL